MTEAADVEGTGRRRLRFARAGLCALLVFGCSSKEGKGSSADDSTSPPPAAQTDGKDDASGNSAGDEESAPEDPIPVDDDNRFVQVDLARFIEQYPDVLRAKDEELFRNCLGDECLEHGVSKSVTPFIGTGVRYLVPLWLRGCMSGSAEACMYAARSYQGSQYTDPLGQGVVHEGWSAEDLQERFRMYIDRACKLDARECEQWADFTLGDPSPSATDIELAIQRLEEGCAREENGACAALARHAAKYPSIGNELDWWRKACEFDPGAPGRACSRYAERLLASGRAADREKAQEVLGPTCDPSSEAWGRVCKGDASTGEEACDPTFVHMRGQACVPLAEKMAGEEGLRLIAAMCVGSLIDETNEIARVACTEAGRRAKQLGKPAAYRAAIARRHCEVKEMTCLSETFNLRACDAARAECEKAADR